jgi:hypothetical protein
MSSEHFPPYTASVPSSPSAWCLRTTAPNSLSSPYRLTSANVDASTIEAGRDSSQVPRVAKVDPRNCSELYSTALAYCRNASGFVPIFARPSARSYTAQPPSVCSELNYDETSAVFVGTSRKPGRTPIQYSSEHSSGLAHSPLVRAVSVYYQDLLFLAGAPPHWDTAPLNFQFQAISGRATREVEISLGPDRKY